MYLKNIRILIIFLFLVIIFLPNKVYAGINGPFSSINPDVGCSAGAVWEGEVKGAQMWDSCPNIDECPECVCDYEWYSPSPIQDIRWFIDGIDYGQPATQINLEWGDDCDCYNSNGWTDCAFTCEGIPITWFVSDTIPSNLSAGTHTLTLRVVSLNRTQEDTCTFTIACDCSGVGWQDPLWWGGCGDCNLNSTNNCEPCGEAQAYCDGCNWDNRWDPFRDEAYTGTGPGHKCPGTPCPINNPPNIPTLIAPPHNTWINYNPTFQAQVSDPDNDNVRAYFNVLDYGDGWGNWVNSNQISSWGPRNIGTCSQDWWRARAQDNKGLWSDWTGYWLTKVDKDNPSQTISYPTGTINYTTFAVSLTESDACSGIAEGDVDIRIKPPGGGWSNWQDYASTINDFSYTGIDGYQYQFRYRTKDIAGNWSNFTEGGTLEIKLNNPPTATNLTVNRSEPCNPPLFYSFTWTYSDPDNDNESRFDFQVDNNSNFSSPEINRSYTNLSNPSPTQNVQAVIVYSNPIPDSLLYNTTYYWRVMVYDTKGADSGWTNGPLFTTPPNPYPIPDFTWLPNRPATEEEVQFTDKTTTLGGATITIWSWTFQDGNPAISNQQNPKIIFVSPGQKSVTLRVTDSNNNTCDKTKTVRVNYPLPRWKEVKP